MKGMQSIQVGSDPRCLGEADPIAISLAQHAINRQCAPLTDNQQITRGRHKKLLSSLRRNQPTRFLDIISQWTLKYGKVINKMIQFYFED